MNAIDYQHLALQVKNRASLGYVAEAGGLIEDAVNKAVLAARGTTESVAKLMDAQVDEIKRLRAEVGYLRAALAERDKQAVPPAQLAAPDAPDTFLPEVER